MEILKMNIVKSRIDSLKKQNGLATLVMLLTCLVVLFATYMSASFWMHLGTTFTSCATFLLLGVFLELSKICAGIAVISSTHSSQNATFKITTITVLAIFTLASFVASVGTIAHELKTGKNTAFSSNSEVKEIQGAIASQEQIIASLLESQQVDTKLGYRARANATLAQIHRAQSDLAGLQNKLHNTKINDASVSAVVLVFNSLISIGEDQWEKVLTLILGALTEITSLFLLYLNFSLKNARVKEKKVVTKNVGELQQRFDGLPISGDEYRQITKQIIAGKVAPTQRGLKKAVRLGNEKIAKIVSRLLAEGVLVKIGKSYKLAA